MKFTATKQIGPIALGKTGGMWAVRDDRTGSINVYPSDKKTAERVFNNKVANLRIVRERDEANASAIAAVNAERAYILQAAAEWQQHADWSDRRVQSARVGCR